MKSVLISIQPKWCELIASGIKVLEVRKTRPKIKTPFKCYIYCTKQRVNGEILLTCDKKVVGRNRGFRDGADIPLAGKVIGEFVCKSTLPISVTYSDPNNRIALREFPYTCLTDKEIMDYLGNGKQGWGWHISDLVIYDKPKGLDDFRKSKECHRGKVRENCIGCWDCEITRPPQSWCYVEEVGR